MKRTSVAALCVALALSACGSPPPEEQPHGYVEGAEESPEAQPAIAYAARGSHRLHLLDLATESPSAIELSIGAQQVSEDGRFVYVTDGDRRLEIVDSGVWTVDHTDHVHYYRAPARSLGTLTFDTKIATVTGFGAHTTIGTADGRIRVLDRRRLEAGRLVELARITAGGTGPLALPYADGLLIGMGGERIVATDAHGRESGALTAPCRAPRDAVVLRGGAIFACDNHWVRVKHGNPLSATILASPRPPGSHVRFGYRPRSNEAALAGHTGVWSVNAAKATLRHVPSAGRRITAAASPADGRTVLALDASGALLSYDLGTGKILAQAHVPATSLTVDVNRAYLSSPRERVIREIDYRDGLRTARTLRTAEQPDLMVEVGR
ncbi:hypothetical protein [Actinoplanes aureus]|uniref:Lipoprotein n=1 Tax=Actinoplanes aureus TaxID=2792083 RepID=A0A931C191_9ACTN|nr:hypothetical protein [Actinoplanes aureus]MBG0561429.1 hypothetical protein [Actinoplanes aureus]